MHDAEECDTLLVVGTTLRNDVGQLVKDLALRVHENEGAVVYIDQADTSNKSLAACRHHIDYHIMMDAQECAQAILDAMDSNDPELASHVWVELSEKILEPSTTTLYPFLDIPYCCQCHFPEPDCLVRCVACGLYYCFEVHGAVLQGMCLTLDMFRSDGFSMSMEDFRAQFRCFECHDHSSTLYPHHVRCIPEYYERPTIKPGLICLVYYLAQFWPLAQHIIGNVTGAWQMKRWQCTCVPVRLQSLEPTTVIDAPGLWKPGEYNVMVIYVTHGSSGLKRFQMADRRELSPADFLDATLKPAVHLLRPAKSTCCFMLTCGHVYDIAENITQIQSWID
ncbi:hypothetical protein FRC06_008345, partial [Ceratobasidium sp. 370]